MQLGINHPNPCQATPASRSQAYDAGSATLAVGCEGSELRLYAASNGEQVYVARGGRRNRIGLVDKAWNTALALLGQGDGGGDAETTPETAPNSLPRCAVGTGYHKLRLYDPRVGKRPQLDADWGEARVTALCRDASAPCQVWAANGAGTLERVDLATGRLAGGIRGISGGIRALALSAGGATLASVGLDRHLRLHCTRTRKLLAKVYLKTCLTTVSFCDATHLVPRPPPPEQQPTDADGTVHATPSAKGAAPVDGDGDVEVSAARGARAAKRRGPTSSGKNGGQAESRQAAANPKRPRPLPSVKRSSHARTER